MITNETFNVKQLSQNVVNYADCHNMKTYDDEGANGNICHSGISDAIENLATIKHSKEETNICRVEEDDMQHVLV